MYTRVYKCIFTLSFNCRLKWHRLANSFYLFVNKKKLLLFAHFFNDNLNKLLHIFCWFLCCASGKSQHFLMIGIFPRVNKIVLLNWRTMLVDRIIRIRAEGSLFIQMIWVEFCAFSNRCWWHSCEMLTIVLFNQVYRLKMQPHWYKFYLLNIFFDYLKEKDVNSNKQSYFNDHHDPDKSDIIIGTYLIITI